MLAVGLMSGTSTDGVSAAVVDITESPRLSARFLASTETPYPDSVRRDILACCTEPVRTQIVCALHTALGHWFAEAALAVCQTAGVPIADVGVVGSHGHTVWHQPVPFSAAERRVCGTLQLGCPATIAAQTGRPVVSDFRSADIAAGGQGAPLVPFADWSLLASESEGRAVQNIGGIANVTWLPPAAALEDVCAFDTGPGNMLIDAAAELFTGGVARMDRDGAMASAGRVSHSLLEELISSDSYFALPPPKSTGREHFGVSYLEGRVLPRATSMGLAPADVMATITAFTADTIAEAYRRHLPPGSTIDTVIVGGGGAKNPALMAMLASRLHPARVTTHDEFGLPSDAKESVAFALLAHETLRGRPANVPSATGARWPAVLGSITPAPPHR